MALKFLIKCILFCAVIFGVVSYLGYLKTGRCWLPSVEMPEFSLPDFNRKPQMNSLQPPPEAAYKWRLNGRWHYGDEPPEGVDAEPINQAEK